MTKKELNQKLAEYKKYFLESNDAEWDWVYFLSLISYKLQRMAKFHSEHGQLVGSEKKAKQMREVSDLLEKVIDFNYSKKYEKELEAKFGKVKHFSKDTGDGCIEFWSKRSRETDANTKKVSKAEKSAIIKADRDRQNDLDKALKIISKNVFYWWD